MYRYLSLLSVLLLPGVIQAEQSVGRLHDAQATRPALPGVG